MITKFGDYVVGLGWFNGLVFGFEFSIANRYLTVYLGPFCAHVGKYDDTVNWLFEE